MSIGHTVLTAGISCFLTLVAITLFVGIDWIAVADTCNDMIDGGMDLLRGLGE